MSFAEDGRFRLAGDDRQSLEVGGMPIDPVAEEGKRQINLRRMGARDPWRGSVSQRRMEEGACVVRTGRALYHLNPTDPRSRE